MPAITIKAFSGIKPLVEPLMLSAIDATVSNNTRLVSGALVPLNGTTTLKALTKAAPQTIFRYGNSATETEYWLEFAGDVDIIRSPVIDEQYGRLYWTDGVQPKYATNSQIVSGASYPGSWYRLGLPKPASAITQSQPPTLTRATATISAEAIAKLVVGDIYAISVDGGNKTLITLTGVNGVVTASSLAGQIGGVTGLTATAVDGAVKIESVSTDTSATFSIEKKTATELNYDPSVVVTTPVMSVANGGNVVATVTGVGTGTPATYTFTGAQIAAITPGTVLNVYINNNPAVKVTVNAGVNTSPATVTATSLQSALSLVAGLNTKIIAGATETLELKTVLKGSTSSIRITTGANYTFSAEQIAGFAVGTVFSVSVNGGAEVQTNALRAGANTSPPVVTATTLRDALSSVSGLSTNILSTIPQTLKIAATEGDVTTSIAISSVTPGTTDVFSKVLTAINTGTYVTESRTYVYTYVSAFGEEGEPSDASAIANVDPNNAVSLSGMSVAPSGNYNITHKRIYRSSTVGSNAKFQFVAEIPVAQTSYTDAQKQSDLGEVLPSEDWVAPPDNLTGLKVTAMGFACGFVGNTVYLSEPNLPHAWPHQYSVDYPIVGLGVFRQSIVVLTTGYPYVLTGVDPAAMSLERLEEPLACTSKRSIVDTENGVLFASTSGLASIGSGGMEVISSTLIDRVAWQAYNPWSMIAFNHDNRYVICFTRTNGTRGMLLFDFSGQGAALTTCDINSDSAITAGYADARTDTLYLAQGTNIVRFNAGTPLTYTWKSKLFRLPYAMNFAAGLLRAKSYPVTLNVYADGVLRHTQTVTGEEIFRLPAGFRAVDWQLEVIGNKDVTEASIATSVEDIKTT